MSRKPNHVDYGERQRSLAEQHYADMKKWRDRAKMAEAELSLMKEIDEYTERYPQGWSFPRGWWGLTITTIAIALGVFVGALAGWLIYG